MILSGRVLKIRNLGGIIFIKLLSDNMKLNVTCRQDLMEAEQFSKIKQLNLNSYCSFEITDLNGDIIVSKLLLETKVIKKSNLEEYRSDILRSYSYLLYVLRGYFLDNRYVEVRLPSIHYGKHKKEAFELEFFQHPARLTTSNALYLNVYAAQMSKVFTLQKCFRAERSHTNRHLAEFDLLEVAQMGQDLTQCMGELEKLIKYIVGAFLNSEFKSMIKLNSDILLKEGFPVISYSELEEKYCIDNKGLGQYERLVAEELPTFVIYYPRGISSWMSMPLDNKYTLSFNLLLPGVGEVVEGNQKQTDLSLLRQKFKVAEVEYQLSWYIEMMPYSNFQLSGFGLGVERLFMWLFGLKNIRDIHPIYRDTRFSELK